LKIETGLCRYFGESEPLPAPLYPPCHFLPSLEAIPPYVPKREEPNTTKRRRALSKTPLPPLLRSDFGLRFVMRVSSVPIAGRSSHTAGIEESDGV